jgi:vacuolar-type H+-ATPase subunit E/Vma4
MTAPRPETAVALAPVREWLLDDARREAEQLVADARADAAERLAQAREEARAMVAQAREAGAAHAEEAVALDVARARREARGVLLAAEESLRQRVRDGVHAGADALRQDPGYPDLLAGLATSAREVLGASALVHEAPGGGVIAQLGWRRVDLSLPALADRALRSVEGEVASLWT